jgi:hypothetical protein
MRLNPIIHGQPLWLRVITSVIWLLLTAIREQRRKERRNRLNPYKDLNPTRGPITCPRCHAPWPGGYEPRTHRELMWKGVVCPECGCEYDDRGRERNEGPRGRSRGIC